MMKIEKEIFAAVMEARKRGERPTEAYLGKREWLRVQWWLLCNTDFELRTLLTRGKIPEEEGRYLLMGVALHRSSMDGIRVNCDRTLRQEIWEMEVK